jgi:hypothetical protein
MNMEGRAVEFRVKVGATATLVLTTKLDLSNTVTFATGKWKVWKPNGTLLINGDIVYTTRASGIISYTLTSSDTATANAGNWSGEVEMLNSSGAISEQTKTFNFTIEESY